LLPDVVAAQGVVLRLYCLLQVAGDLSGVAVTLAGLQNPWLGLGQLLLAF
jgi:hypothetical protein